MIALLHSPTFIILEIAFATIALFAGLTLVIHLAITVAANLDPEPRHSGRFYALKTRTVVAAMLIALGFGLLALIVALASL